MKTILVALALLIAAIASYLSLTSLHLHMLRPWPVYLSLGAALAVALRSRAGRAIKIPVVALCLLVGVPFIAYQESLSRIEMPELTVRVGEPFPDFTLPTSQGESFSSASLRGTSRALYIFYRGDW